MALVTHYLHHFVFLIVIIVPIACLITLKVKAYVR